MKIAIILIISLLIIGIFCAVVYNLPEKTITIIEIPPTQLKGFMIP